MSRCLATDDAPGSFRVPPPTRAPHRPPSRPAAQQLRGTLNVAALSAFLAYVGAGLDGQAGLRDFNLQLNDDYQRWVVKG